MDDYEIKEEEGKFVVYEKHPGRSVKLQTCDTEKEADLAIDQWKARDQLSEKIEEFLEEVDKEFSGMLDRDEIRQMIREDAQ